METAMTDRLLVLLACAVVGVLLWFAYRFVRTRGRSPDRLDIDALGLELMSGCCAFVVFTTPACKPCKTALRVVGDAAGRRPGLTEVTSVDAIERAELATRFNVRTVPTVFLITASGHVLRTWRDVPDPLDVDTALEAV
jgi:glutaredoxin